MIYRVLLKNLDPVHNKLHAKRRKMDPTIALIRNSTTVADLGTTVAFSLEKAYKMKVL